MPSVNLHTIRPCCRSNQNFTFDDTTNNPTCRNCPLSADPLSVDSGWTLTLETRSGVVKVEHTSLAAPMYLPPRMWTCAQEPVRGARDVTVV